MAKNFCTDKAEVPWCIVMANESVLVPPSFHTFSADLLPHTLQNLVVMLVNRLVWRNKFLMSNSLTVKKYHQHALDV